MLRLELLLLYFLFLPWCNQIIASDMTVQCPPAFRLSYVAIVHASSCLAIFLLFSPLYCPLLLSFISVSVFRHLALCNTTELVLFIIIIIMAHSDKEVVTEAIGQMPSRGSEYNQQGSTTSPSDVTAVQCGPCLLNGLLPASSVF